MSKILLTDIQELAASLKWKLLSTKYENLDSELHFVCPEGHNVFITYRKWRKEQSCPVCKNNPLKDFSQKIEPKGKEFRVFSLDAATRVTGWAVFDGSKLVRYGTKEFTEKDVDVRIGNLKQWIVSFIGNWKPDLIIFEDIQLQRLGGEFDNHNGVTTFKILAILQGVLRNLFYENKISYKIVPAATWREHCQIKGRTKVDKKKNAQLKVKDWYDVSVTDDAAEAICIGKYGAEIEKAKNQMVKWE